MYTPIFVISILRYTENYHAGHLTETRIPYLVRVLSGYNPAKNNVRPERVLPGNYGETKMSRKITEKMLLDNYNGICKGGTKISVIGSLKIYWDYRTGDTGDGCNCVTSRDRAEEITLEYDRFGVIPLDSGCDNHPATAKIVSDEAALWGDEVS